MILGVRCLVGYRFDFGLGSESLVRIDCGRSRLLWILGIGRQVKCFLGKLCVRVLEADLVVM